MIRQINYTRPPLYPYQTQILNCPARYTVTLAATKCGKTTSHIVWLFEQALQCSADITRMEVDENGLKIVRLNSVGKVNRSVWWIAPSFGQAKIAYNRMKAYISDQDFFSANETNLVITLATGVKIEFKTGEKPDNLYGDDVYAFVFDEFPRAREAAWHALRSTITSTGGKGKFIGNAKSKKNWGVKLAMRAKSGQDVDFVYFKITAYDAADAGMKTKDGRPFIEEIEAAKRDLPEYVFNELYLAEASEDGSNPFGLKYIALCCYPDMSKEKSICYGIDLAKSVDWTSIIGLDKLGAVSHYDTFTKTSWKFTTDTIKRLPNSTPIAIDSTGVGDPIAEDVATVMQNVELYKFTSLSKQQLMEGLAVAIQNRKVVIPDDGDTAKGTGRIRHQLEQYEYTFTRSGVKYTAPEGEHDDDVVALALAWHKYKTAALNNGEISIM